MITTWIIAVAAAVATLGGVWKGVIKPTMDAYGKIDRYGPVLAAMAQQFDSDGGSTLRDTVNRLEAKIDKNTAAIQDLVGQFNTITKRRGLRG